MLTITISELELFLMWISVPFHFVPVFYVFFINMENYIRVQQLS